MSLTHGTKSIKRNIVEKIVHFKHNSAFTFGKENIETQL